MHSHGQGVGINGELTVITNVYIAVYTVVLVCLDAHGSPVWSDIYGMLPALGP